MNLTKKQHWIMQVIMRGHRNEEGIPVEWCDIKEVAERVPYPTTRESMHFSIRLLIRKGLVERLPRVMRRERWVTPLAPTNLAYDILRPRTDPRLVEHDNDVVEEIYD